MLTVEVSEASGLPLNCVLLIKFFLLSNNLLNEIYFNTIDCQLY